MWDFEAQKTDRLDRVLRGCALPGAEWLSRQAWDWLVENDQVDVNGRKARKPGAEIAQGARIQVRLPNQDLGLIPSAQEAELIWADDRRQLGIFAKNCGISSISLFPWEHRSFANEVSAFLCQRAWLSAEDFSLLGPPPKLEGGLLQRLDRDTSGLIAVAFNQETKNLFRQLIGRSCLEKTYLAIAGGDLSSLEGEHQIWLSQASGQKVRASLEREKGEWEPITLSLEVCKSFAHSALVKVVTRQGSRHLVRAGLAALGAPLVGDKLYGGAETEPFHQLHASRLRLLEPNAFPAFPATVDAFPPQSFLDSLSRLGLHWSG